MITVSEVKTTADIKKFVKFPFTLYKDSKYWVPPIIADEMETFNKDKTLHLKMQKLLYSLPIRIMKL